MNKLEVQQRVLRDGKPLDLSLFEWDEKTLTFSSRESKLVIDFNGSEHCTFKTGWRCTLKTGEHCTFKTGGYCTFDTGGHCTFKTSWDCTFKTGGYCTFKTGGDCTFKTGGDCTFKTGWHCTFDTGEYCTFDTGGDCTFKTGWHCTFKTGGDCTFIINGYKFPVCPPRFNGSKYSIYINEPDSLTAGCVTKPLSWWKENVRRYAEENSCTPDQQDEAELYVQMAELWLNKYSSQIIKESA